METVAQLVLLALLVGTAKAYLDGGWPRARLFWRSKLVGLGT